MIKKLYEVITGTPWTTGRSAAADFGPPPGAVYATEWAHLSDAELCTLTCAEAIAYAQAIRTRHTTTRERGALTAVA